MHQSNPSKFGAKFKTYSKSYSDVIPRSFQIFTLVDVLVNLAMAKLLALLGFHCLYSYQGLIPPIDLIVGTYVCFTTALGRFFCLQQEKKSSHPQ